LKRRLLLGILVVVAVAASASAAAFYVFNVGPTCIGNGSAGNFLIVATANGYNDSITHGVPQGSWPVIHVAKGTTVNITVCNEDRQAHGFQVAHYFDNSIETVAPGQKISVTFVADQPGTFRIYCSIFCTVHSFMQSGELVVS
jgi:heme/copper-type cytochrome/quinol oxidase subunit 2